MNFMSAKIISHHNCATIQLTHNDESVIVAQEYKNGFKLPLKGIIKALYKLIKLKNKSRRGIR